MPNNHTAAEQQSYDGQRGGLSRSISYKSLQKNILL